MFTRDPDAFAERVREFRNLMVTERLQLQAGHAGPGFHRFLVSDGSEGVPVDLVLDTAPAVEPPNLFEDGMAVDSLIDIAANKLATIVGRAEVRDLIDLFFLERAGIDLLSLVPAAQTKDAGADAATLAWVLSEVKIHRVPPALARPITADELQAFVDVLRARLARAAFTKHEV